MCCDFHPLTYFFDAQSVDGGMRVFKDLDNVLWGSSETFFGPRARLQYCQSLNSCQLQSEGFIGATIWQYFAGLFLRVIARRLLHILARETSLIGV